MKYLFFLFICLFPFGLLQNQIILEGLYSTDFPFINKNVNYFQYKNNRVLEKFYNKWNDENGANIHIAHFGDSHVQPDYFTSVVRNSLQQLKGNGGRGMIFPYAIAKTYSQSDFKSSFTGNWVSSNSIHQPPKLPLGVSGFVAHTSDTAASFSIYFTKPLSPGAKFIKVFCNKEISGYNLTVQSRNNYQTISFANYTDPDLPYLLFFLPQVGDTIEFKLHKSLNDFKTFELHGISIENDTGGLLYHNLGVGGATFSALLNQTYFKNHFPILTPDLVILDWGTNDIIYNNRVDDELASVIVNSINKIRTIYPDVTILLTSVQDMNRKGANISSAKQFENLVRNIAFQYDCLYYDWYSVAGGPNSMKLWFNNNLAAKDNIHLTKKGYELKGNLFTAALLNTLSFYGNNPQNCCMDASPAETISTSLSAAPPSHQPTNNNVDNPTNKPHRSYIVKSGDTLSSIARKNNVSISNLMSWNNLISDKIYPKQSLIVSQSK